jgi:hypothetical protein
MVEGFFNGANLAKEIFCLVVMELWLQQFASRAVSAPQAAQKRLA